MEKVPEDVMVGEILLKLPANSLVNIRYVAKDFRSLITSPSFLKMYLRHSIAQQLNPNSLLICSHHAVTRFRIHNFRCNIPPIITSSSSSTSSPEIIRPEIVEMHLPFESTEIRASCNGLLYLHQRFRYWIDKKCIDDISYYIWNPCTREYKQLPPPPPPLLLDRVDLGNFQSWVSENFTSSSGFCGFGYDRNNDEYKILHYENRIDLNYIYVHDGLVRRVQSISSVVEFKLYTLGTNTWARIADNPYRSFYFTDPNKRTGLLVNGALHWLMSLSDPAPKAGKIISFDIEKEVFREVPKPHCYNSSKQEEEEEYYYSGSLQILQERLCMCKVHFHGEDYKIDIWMLMDYDVMHSWTKLFRVVIPGEKEFNYYQFRLLRYCENGEILMLKNIHDVIVYNPVNHTARCAIEFNIRTIPVIWKYFVDYTESLVCLNSGTYRSSYRAN